MKSKTELQDGLAMFHGGIECTRFSPMLFPKCVATEGVVWLAENAECYWLLDAIASHLNNVPATTRQDMLIWRLVVTPGENRAAVLFRDDGDGEWLTIQEFELTTFPLDEITIWTMGSGDEAGEHVTLLLPSEY